MRKERVAALRISLHDTTVGYLAGYEEGRNILTFDRHYVAMPPLARPTLTLFTALPERASHFFQKPLVTRQKLHPLLSNLLPEGAMREHLAQQLKIHPDNEFPLLAYLGEDLPGALKATPVDPHDIPSSALIGRTSTLAVPIDVAYTPAHFSLAGVQIKFSMKARDGRYLYKDGDSHGDWIIKTPSTLHQHVPLNEYTTMSLASLIGIDIPEISLIELDRIDNLPSIPLPDERYAYGIKRFDRGEHGQRIHTEDFAQVFFEYARNKYDRHNYEEITRKLKEETLHRPDNIRQITLRLLANILLGNGDAHLKNWSLIYRDKRQADLSPAYDIVFTRAYMGDERDLALNMGGVRRWYETSLSTFDAWADASGLNRRFIGRMVKQAIEQARDLWPEALAQSPMPQAHQKLLKDHWQQLHPDFRITSR